MSEPKANPDQRIDRRSFMTYFSAIGLGGSAFPDILWDDVQEEPEITSDMLEAAERIAGLEFDDDEREMMLRDLTSNLASYRQMREVSVPNDVPPAITFDPVPPGMVFPKGRGSMRISRPPPIARPDNLEEVAFWPITHTAELLRTRQVTSVELTRMYLDRLRLHGLRLECVITLTEDLAITQASRADAEIARGHYRGPLHGIPWGAKDLLSTGDHRTTWGAKPFEDQVLPTDSTVVTRLEEAGAVLVAKLTLGALAMGDYWFGGRTRNPWDLEQGSSGSSAGSAAATVAGLVGISIGSETLGSIVSPSTRCGATGLRPTFGRVSRYGAMALSWSMDKLGPLCRNVEDCAVVLNAIHGSDGGDPTARDVPFNWDPDLELSDLRVGYYESAFEAEPQNDTARERKPLDVAVLDRLRDLGMDLIPMDVPDTFPVGALRIILNAEAASAFDELTRSGRDDLLTRQQRNAWPNSFRQARFIPAVEYIQANRIRTMVIEEMNAAMNEIDVLVTPSFGRNVLITTNLTGHPSVTVPNGFLSNGTPSSISFIGKLFGEAKMLAVAKRYQDATGFHLRQPPAFSVNR